MRTYEHVAMLASIIQSVHIDNDWVAQQYNEQCKKRNWKKENTEEAVKCWNIKRIIDAEQQGKDAPFELKMEDLLNEETGMEGDSEKDAGDVTFKLGSYVFDWQQLRVVKSEVQLKVKSVMIH